MKTIQQALNQAFEAWRVQRFDPVTVDPLDEACADEPFFGSPYEDYTDYQLRMLEERTK